MKIVLFSNTSWSLFNFRKNLIKSLVEKGYNVTLISSKDKYIQELEKISVNIKILDFETRGVNLFKELFLISNIINLYKEIKPDLIFHFTIKPVIYGSIVSRFMNISTVNNITGLGRVFEKKNIFRFLIILLYKFSQKKVKNIFFQNINDQKFFLEKKIIHISKTTILPGSGVDLNFYNTNYYPAENETINFLFASRLIIQKGLNEFLDAAKFFKLEFPNVNFLVCGKGEKEGKNILIEKLYEFNQKKIIQYLGFNNSNELKKIIIKSHCVVLPTFYNEGTPKILLEAMSLKRPIITSNISGCIDLVQNNKNGYLCKIKDSLDLINNLKKFLLLKHSSKINFGLYSRQIVEKKYDEKIVINEYLNQINNL